ncbi:MAG: site-specific integrase, partial [Alteromonas sp.]|nr:site-specific integrase [Alteromonas sp.]
GLAAATANHQVKLLRRALNLAAEWGMLKKNPAAQIPLFTEDNKVENYLDQEELENLLTILRTDRNRTVCHIALFLLSTGARLNEALQATWRQCDRVNQVWRIPASNSKSKGVHSVPLNDAALNVLDQLDTEGRFEYLFINQRTGKPYTTIHKTWEQLRNEAGLPHLRIHDLRHQHASFLVNSERTLYEVQQILGHSDPKVTQRYAHLSTRALQEAASSASDIINGAMPK